MRPRRSGNLLTLALGLCFLAGAAYAYDRMGDSQQRLREARAVVVDVVYESGTKKGRTHPVVRFRTADGIEVTAGSQEHRPLRPGDAVAVLYNPERPSEVSLGSLADARRKRVLVSALFAAIGLGTCFMAFAFDVTTMRWRFRKYNR